MNRIILLGTGCPSPSHIRYGPSTLIFTEKQKILIDAGSGVTQRLSEFGLAPSEIDVILITHLHSDHIVDLYQLYISGWHTGRTKPFKIVRPKGIKKFFDKTIEAFADELNLRVDWEKRPNHEGLDIEITEIDKEFVYESMGIKITSIEVQHQPVEPAYGYQFFVDDKKITYSGDTRYSINLEKASEDADYLIHEVFVSLNFDETRNITPNSVLIESLTYLGSSLIIQENLDQDYYDFILKLEIAMQEISSGMRPQIVLSNLTINSGSNE